MPNNKEFNNIKIKSISINKLDGWNTPLIIEYYINMLDITPTVYWKVKGTKHTFEISLRQLDYLSKGDYAQHFKETLQKFREDYIEWKTKYNFEAEWMQEYYRQFNIFITI